MFSDSVYWSALGRCRRCMPCHKRVERPLVMWPRWAVNIVTVQPSSSPERSSSSRLSLSLLSEWVTQTSEHILTAKSMSVTGKNDRKRNVEDEMEIYDRKCVKEKISSVGGLRWISQEHVKNTSRDKIKRKHIRIIIWLLHI